ncbi:bifunctional pyr operon transcriptional regulator/uracil phosphoribosyltransferase [Oleiphilus sp. HI0081]|jgi:pyrimidine operon attenuation protein/uracil phosphoribosyltransferase|uniref:bifunctional pyr operon transcriptional regulator/uracil phosphoribosyltransferase PyrR n=3 Tax=Oleiphilus TaxID=141450 RepID=UPI0007C366DD|nr:MULTISPECIES: bifunctional pyr operon transcriptional regulator/uracil phosphoribosyltransferase PyrR [unclassified Oleiphilus]KZY42859.1 bifunctional pyr operon transcriptional regulator/uracil phosphoribosyltransferase [Oleiphilus sp. HI0050]KZY75102.1 bifunctional pyr operon transcriptional regulator/uracil phosphoribosyltransferase [Oleiphilus sp. HI0069]KZY87596.1 bifunctional pyr operon transcriptional regulator/uracil phosphoribosyltransferase [Oleiphilus sp. HI0072]KZZ09914.1 bifunct
MHDEQAVEALLGAMSQQLSHYLAEKNITDYEFVGIRTGGVWVAKAIQKSLANEKLIGELDISFYRDDFTQIGLNPKVEPSSLPFETKDKHIVLFDDVLMSGRTVRAAMNELFDYGRPASITLAVLVDVGRPELPIAPHVVGAKLSLAEGQRIKLIGPENLHLKIQ